MLENQKEEATAVGLIYNNLNYKQKQKYDYLYRIYNDEPLTVQLVTLIDGRGKNSWSTVLDKISELESAKINEQQYHDALYDCLELTEVYTSADIMGIVGEVRRDLDLRPYSSRLKANCENDFFRLFIVHDVYEDVVVDGQVKKKHIGYKPVFKLKPED